MKKYYQKIHQSAIAAYEAYGIYREWKTHDDKPMPKWDALSDEIKTAWNIAFEAGLNKFIEDTK